MEGNFINNIFVYIIFWRISHEIILSCKIMANHGESLSSGFQGVGSNEDMVVEPGVEGREPSRPSMAHGD